MHFIASGAVELQTAGQTWRLGRGEMFGQMAILMQKLRRTEVTAIAPSSLLVLDEARFRRLLKRSQPMQAAVIDSARRRGLDPAQVLESVGVTVPPAMAKDRTDTGNRPSTPEVTPETEQAAKPEIPSETLSPAPAETASDTDKDTPPEASTQDRSGAV